MSLVLDALRRREAESDPYRRTALDAPSSAPTSSRPWVALVAIGLLLNAVALTWFMVTRPAGESRGPAASAEPQGAETPVAASPAASALTAAPLAATSPLAASPQTTTLPGAAAPAMTAPPAPQPGITSSTPIAAPLTSVPVRTLERIDLEDLPDAARSRLPGIVISSLIYSDDPMERTIIANGVTLREGSVLAGLPLREIRGDSIVVEFESWLLEVPVFSEW
jgi:hypothetical protein